MSLTYFVIDLPYNNKVYEQGLEKGAHVHQAFPDSLSFRALAEPTIRPLITSSCQHSPLKIVIDSKPETWIKFLLICLETLLPKQTKKFMGFSGHMSSVASCDSPESVNIVCSSGWWLLQPGVPPHFHFSGVLGNLASQRCGFVNNKEWKGGACGER